MVRDTVHLPFCITQRDAPQVRLQLTFHRIGETEVQAAVRHNDSAQVPQSLPHHFCPFEALCRGEGLGVMSLSCIAGANALTSER